MNATPPFTTCGAVRSVHVAPLSRDTKRRELATNIHTTPFPAAATCALVGNGIGVTLDAGAVDDAGAPAGVAMALGAAVAGVVVGDAVGVDAAGPQATNKNVTNTTRERITRDIICSLNDRGVSGVPVKAYECRRSC